MSTFLLLLISGCVSGAIYSLFAAGLTVLYSTTGVYNFAFGAMALSTAIIFYQLDSGLRWPTGLALAVAVGGFAPALGLVVEATIFGPLAAAPVTTRIVGGIGLLIALPALVYFTIERLTVTFGFELASMSYVQVVPGLGPSPPRAFELMDGVKINSDQLVVLAAAVVAAGGLWLLVNQSSLGLRMRATVDRPQLAQLRGVSPVRTSRLAWVVGSVLAGIAGVVAAPLYGLSQANALQFVVASSAVVVFARFRSLPVALFGGLALGALVNLLTGYSRRIPAIDAVIQRIPGLSGATIYLVLFVVLYVRGRPGGRAAAAVADGAPPNDHRAHLSRRRRAGPWVVAGAVLLVWTFGLVPVGWTQAGPVERGLVMTGLCMSLVYLSFTIVTGLGGMISLAQAAFVTAGALTAGAVGRGASPLTFVASLLAAVAVAVVLGGLTAVPALRLGGIALALATLGLALLGDSILFQIDWFDNEGSGWVLRRPRLGPIDFAADKPFVAFLLLVVIGLVGFVGRFQRAQVGRMVVAVRSAEPAATSVGLSPARAKLIVFAVAAGIAGLGGALLAYNDGAATSSRHPAAGGLLWLAIAATWGLRRPAAAVLAGVTSVLLPRLIQQGWLFVPGTSSVHVPAMLFGLAAIGLAQNPDGILAQLATLRRRSPPAVADDASPSDRDDPATAPRPTIPTTAPVVTGEPRRSVDPDRTPVLEVSALRAGYGDIVVLDGVDLRVRAGEIVAVVGPNGAGKSTLCAAIAGTVPSISGSVRLFGEAAESLRPDARARRGVVLVPESRGVFPSLSIDDNLAMWAGRADRELVYDRFPQFAHRRHTEAGNLSGGEQQLLSLAPFLVAPPLLLIADEPTLGLAPLAAAELKTVLRELAGGGVAVVLVEEKPRLVVDLVDRLVVLSGGRITWTGEPAELSDDAAIARAVGLVGAAVPSGRTSDLAATEPAALRGGHHQGGNTPS